jgi:predicted amidophosphoribosyltransferase
MTLTEASLFLVALLSSIAFLVALRWGRRGWDQADLNAQIVERMMPMACAELATRRHKLTGEKS